MNYEDAMNCEKRMTNDGFYFDPTSERDTMKKRPHVILPKEYTLKSGRTVKVGDSVTIPAGVGYNLYDNGLLRFHRSDGLITGIIERAGSGDNETAVCDTQWTVYIRFAPQKIATTEISLVE